MKNLKTKNFAVASALGALMLSAVALTVPAVYAATDSVNRAGLNFDPGQHEAVEEALEAGDYDAWATLMSDCPRGEKMLELITEDNFPKFVESHELMEQARSIREELGLTMGRGGIGFGKGDSVERGDFEGARRGMMNKNMVSE